MFTEEAPMDRAIVFFTQAYLHLVPARTWKQLACSTRLLLVIYEGDTPHPTIAPFVSDVIRVPGFLEPHCPPVLDVDHAEVAVRETLAGNRLDTNAVSVFCQGEFNLFNAARLRQRLGLAGDLPEVVRLFRDKIAMKRALVGTRITLPKFVEFSRDLATSDMIGYYTELVSQLSTPLVVKPTGSAGSYGVSIVRNAQDFV